MIGEGFSELVSVAEATLRIAFQSPGHNFSQAARELLLREHLVAWLIALRIL